jgi:hypothetical protein
MTRERGAFSDAVTAALKKNSAVVVADFVEQTEGTRQSRDIPDHKLPALTAALKAKFNV